MAGRLGAMLAAARRNKRARVTVVGLAAGVAIATISACTTGDVFALQPAVDVGSQTAAVPQPDTPQYSGMQRLVPSNPYMTQAAYPRMDEPMSPTEQMPASEIDCRNELKRMGVVYQDIQPIHEGQCGIDYPVKVTAIGSVAMKPAATLTCNMAATFAAWTRNELQPAARWRYFSGVKAIHQGSSYSCRNIAGEGVLSEHGKGNALDVMSIELNNGDDIDVRKPGLFAFRTRGFLNNVRADGCQYFTTVLGPGYNYDHRNHFHFDIKNRKSGYRACR